MSPRSSPFVNLSPATAALHVERAVVASGSRGRFVYLPTRWYTLPASQRLVITGGEPHDSMFEVVFLGTSASAPSTQRGLSSAVVMHGEYRFMVDCGEGTQRQLLRSGLGFKRLDHILITHGHLDHILGLGGLASTLGRWETLDRLDIYGGASALKRIEALLRVVFGSARLPLTVTLNTLLPGPFFDTRAFGVSAFPVVHRGPDCFGFTFAEKARRPFLADKALALGVPVGPIRRRLVDGQAVTLDDGRVIQPDDVLGPESAGAKLVFIHDVHRVDGLVETVRGADALVIEATYCEDEADLAREYGHLTAAEAARLAVAADVKQLILTHLSRRYHTQQVLDEARAIFSVTAVANDFDRFRIVKGRPVELVRGEPS